MRKKLPIEYLKVGMYICQKPDQKNEIIRFLEQGFVTRIETIERLRHSGIHYVIIDSDKGLDSEFSHPLELTPITPLKSFEQERPRAEKIYRSAIKTMNLSMSQLRGGFPLDIDSMQGVANEICQSVLKNPNALLILSQIREKDEYLLQHSINVAILMAIWTQQTGYSIEKRIEMVTGALFHDIGKIRIPDKILNKPDKLSPSEWKEMKRHVEYGYEALFSSKGVTDLMLDICGSHHERLNGRGYPKGLSKNAISIAGRMIAIVDMFDAMSAERVYKPGLSPSIVMKKLVELSDDELDKSLVYQFIQCFGAYPTGTLVELSNHRVGVVLVPNLERPNRPLVRVMFNASSKSYEAITDIDLSKSAKQLTIISIRDPSDFSIKVSDFL